MLLQKIISISQNNLKPNCKINLENKQIVLNTGKGTYIDQSCVLKIKSCGLCWSELQIINPGNTDCSIGLQIIEWTDLILSSYMVDGYDTCSTCHGEGIIKHGFRSFNENKIMNKYHPSRNCSKCNSTISKDTWIEETDTILRECQICGYKWEEISLNLHE